MLHFFRPCAFLLPDVEIETAVGPLPKPWSRTCFSGAATPGVVNRGVFIGFWNSRCLSAMVGPMLF